ncbi:MAG: leucyl/phenylalanyl-tRNA--protein transferase [Phycisphaeraceae bacterium]|nr:leucyl/phenylalanyl-tRNA--protein transferase [Phycisphaeraceae bacterium]MCW5768385.1 leucyl/phenylalanyl-tRNA--protein transferase [Phycisphaeraceae bacterium]
MLRDLYRRGMFLMADEERGEINAYEADPRAIVPLREEDGLRIPRSLRQRVRSGRFRVTSDVCFGRVIEACAEAREGGTWISPPLAALYTALHASGERDGVHAHSVEAWVDGPEGALLVGGLYGVAVGAVFCGESMFSRPGEGGTDASKVCLVHLIRHLNERGFELLDSQIWNPHLARFGAREISASMYRARLSELRDRKVGWGPFAQGL